jgi:hypothetical protein
MLKESDSEQDRELLERQVESGSKTQGKVGSGSNMLYSDKCRRNHYSESNILNRIMIKFLHTVFVRYCTFLWAFFSYGMLLF